MPRRTDIHSPANFDPADYTLLLIADLADGFAPDYEVDRDDARLHAPSFPGHFDARGGCDHCGAHGLRYIAVFHCATTGENVTVGMRCAGNLDLTSLTERDVRRRTEHASRLLRAVNWAAASEDNARCMAILDANLAASTAWGDATEAANINGTRFVAPGPRPNSFLSDLRFKLIRYGSLSERQVAAALRSAERDAEYAARRAAREEADAAALANAPDLAAGRRLMTGTILSTKFQDSDYGGSMKMLVRLDDGNKVWGTVPASLYVLDVNDCAGTRVEFTATVKCSDRDSHFGFFSRPTGARSLDEEVTA